MSNGQIRVSFFGKHGTVNETTYNGPHALRDFFRTHPGAQLEPRYSASGRRMTRRGSVEVRTVAVTVTVTALRAPNTRYAPKPEPKKTRYTADEMIAGMLYCQPDGTLVKLAQLAEYACQVCGKPSGLTRHPALCPNCEEHHATSDHPRPYRARKSRRSDAPMCHVPPPMTTAERIAARDRIRDWSAAGTIEPTDDGAPTQLAIMPQPTLTLETQAVPMKQAKLI